MKLTRTVFSIAAASLFFASAAFSVGVGETAPDFQLTDIEGNSHSLSDYAGKVVVLEWTNYGCPFVRNHYDSGHMQGLQGDAKDQGVVWLSICSSAPGTQGNMSPEKWQTTTSSKGVNASAVLIDESGKVGRMYSAKTTPHMYVINAAGEVAYNGAIDSIPSTRKSDLEKATNYVAAAMKAVLSGEPVETPTSKPYGCGIKYASDS